MISKYWLYQEFLFLDSNYLLYHLFCKFNNLVLVQVRKPSHRAVLTQARTIGSLCPTHYCHHLRCYCYLPHSNSGYTLVYISLERSALIMKMCTCIPVSKSRRSSVYDCVFDVHGMIKTALICEISLYMWKCKKVIFLFYSQDHLSFTIMVPLSTCINKLMSA